MFNVYYSKGVSYCHLGLAETQRQAREHKSFIVKKKKKKRKRRTSGVLLKEVVGMRKLASG